MGMREEALAAAKQAFALRSEIGHRGQESVLSAFPMHRYVNGVLDAYVAALAGRVPEPA